MEVKVLDFKMAKKKRKFPSMTGIAVGGIVATTVVGNIASASGSPTASNLSGKFATGVGKVGNVLPLYGAVKGTQMVLKPIGKLRKKSSKLLKGGYKL